MLQRDDPAPLEGYEHRHRVYPYKVATGLTGPRQCGGCGARLCMYFHPSGLVCMLERGHPPGHRNPYQRRIIVWRNRAESG